MGADIKNLRLRIKSVDSTLHLTKAMGLVASSKIRRANEGMENGLEYMSAVSNMMDMLSNSAECQKSPFMQSKDGSRIRLIVIAGDRGLCGGYNANIFRMVRDFPDAEIIPIGKRAAEHYSGEFVSSEKYSCRQGYDLAVELCRDFEEDKYDSLGIISTKYISVMTQEATLSWVLPFEKKNKKTNNTVLFEPDESEILKTAVIEYVSGVIMACVRESFACEVAARRMAMDNAGKNAKQMIDDLTLSYNRARQGAITQEITEIVAGSGG